eukprot:6189704-Pleurochrysis_carterae.AAC.2
MTGLEHVRAHARPLAQPAQYRAHCIALQRPSACCPRRRSTRPPTTLLQTQSRAARPRRCFAESSGCAAAVTAEHCVRRPSPAQSTSTNAEPCRGRAVQGRGPAV